MTVQLQWKIFIGHQMRLVDNAKDHMIGAKIGCMVTQEPFHFHWSEIRLPDNAERHIIGAKLGHMIIMMMLSVSLLSQLSGNCCQVTKKGCQFLCHLTEKIQNRSHDKLWHGWDTKLPKWGCSTLSGCLTNAVTWQVSGNCAGNAVKSLKFTQHCRFHFSKCSNKCAMQLFTVILRWGAFWKLQGNSQRKEKMSCHNGKTFKWSFSLCSVNIIICILSTQFVIEDCGWNVVQKFFCVVFGSTRFPVIFCERNLSQNCSPSVCFSWVFGSDPTMTINDLWNHMFPKVKEHANTNISSLSGLIAGVDVAGWMCHAMLAKQSTVLALTCIPPHFLDKIASTLSSHHEILVSVGIHPVCAFNGLCHPMKSVRKQLRKGTGNSVKIKWVGSTWAQVSSQLQPWRWSQTLFLRPSTRQTMRTTMKMIKNTTNNKSMRKNRKKESVYVCIVQYSWW